MIIPIDQMPERVPFMLLPNAVLLPNTVMPLHIFEKKYRLMLADCLAGDRMFGVAMVRPGVTEVQSGDDVFQHAGVGLIRACVGNADGTSTLILHGLGRFLVTRWERSKPYWVGAIEPVVSVGDGQTDDLEREVLDRCAQLEELARDVLPPLRGYRPGESDPSLLADVVGGALLDTIEDRQALLEEPSVRQRLAFLLQRM